MKHLIVGSAIFFATVAAFPVGAREYSGEVISAMHHMEAQDRIGGIRSLLAPGTAVPKIGPDGSVLDYVRWAASSLDRGQKAEAELSLEWGQVRRRIDEEENAMAVGKPAPTYDAQCSRSMCKAMRSIGSGDASSGREYLRAALIEFTQENRPHSDYADPAEGAPASTMDTAVRKSMSNFAELTDPGK